MGIFGKLFGSTEPEALPEQAILIDVRSPAEFESGHLKDAVTLPLPALSQGIAGIAPDKNQPVIVYCQSGGRSAMAQQQLRAMGYRHVVNGGGVQDLARRMRREILR